MTIRLQCAKELLPYAHAKQATTIKAPDDASGFMFQIVQGQVAPALPPPVSTADSGSQVIDVEPVMTLPNEPTES
jgi:hypothetical protein